MTTKESEVDVLAWIDAATVAVGIVADGADTKMKRLAKPVRDAVAEVFEAAKRASALVNLLTVRQVIEAGDEAIQAADLNPWCINEGLAEGGERIDFWRLRTALRNAGVKP